QDGGLHLRRRRRRRFFAGCRLGRRRCLRRGRRLPRARVGRRRRLGVVLSDHRVLGVRHGVPQQRFLVGIVVVVLLVRVVDLVCLVRLVDGRRRRRDRLLLGDLGARVRGRG